MAKDRFKGKTTLDHLRDQKSSEIVKSSFSNDDRKPAWRVYQLRLLDFILRAPELDEVAKAWATRELEWLNRAPGHRLSFQSAAKATRLEHAAWEIRSGRENQNRNLPSLRVRQVKPFGANRPEWMKDPALLPKKPPNRT
jgi:hypothetical protein